MPSLFEGKKIKKSKDLEEQGQNDFFKSFFFLYSLVETVGAASLQNVTEQVDCEWQYPR